MGFLKKTVLLSNQGSYDKGMAILTIEKNNSGVFGSIKIFDFPKTTNLMLGISIDNKEVIKQHVMFLNGNIFNFKLDNNFNINGKIGCVIVEINDDKANALVWGTNSNQAQYKQDILHIFEKDVEKVSSADLKTEPHFNVVKVEESTFSDNNNDINSELFESNEEEIENIIDREIGGDFFALIHGQIEELFNKFPINEDLSRIIPGSKWVKLNYGNDENEYVFGLIYSDSKVKYICYGVPGKFDVLPPEDLGNYSQWLPMDEDNNRGYWLMYQDADTGESVLLDDVKLS